MKKLKGITCSEGIAIGYGQLFKDVLAETDHPEEIDRELELSKLMDGKQRVTKELIALYEEMRQSVGETEAQIFVSHQEMLADPSFFGEIKERVEQGKTAISAVQEVTKEVAQMFTGLEDTYLRQRASDIQDIGRQLIERMLEPSAQTTLESIILCGVDIPPSFLAKTSPQGLKGVVTEEGGQYSHSAIIARAKGIPFMVKTEGLVQEVKNGDLLIIDGFSGEVWINPDEPVLLQYKERKHRWENKKKQVKAKAKLPCFTTDNQQIEIMANIGDHNEVETALASGAEGVGLFRTEFLFLDKPQAPTEEEQYKQYKSVLEAFYPKPVIIRTLDIGGDKQIPYLNLPKEENPFLGLRGIRYCLTNQDLFKIQLRALVRSAVFGNLYIMLPMVSTLEEIALTKQLLEEVSNDLFNAAEVEKIPDFKLGIMVEVPNVVELIDLFVHEVDFFSVGTNDLLQYLMATDRLNSSIAQLYDVHQLSLYRMMDKVVQTAHVHGKEVSVCGEISGNPQIAPLLVGIGVNKLSMSPAQIPLVKETIRKANRSRLQEKWKDAQRNSLAKVDSFIEDVPHV